MNAVADIVRGVEQLLSSFYDFPLAASAADHLISKPELLAQLGDAATARPEWTARGGVWLIDGGDPTAHDDLFIGLNVDASVADELAAADPRHALDNGNLDPFCVIVEEVSHFHLLVNRAQRGRQVTRLELECQGEIDKLLVCATTLESQSGDPHLLPLARMLYDHAAIVSSDVELYSEATKYAARFWFDALRHDASLSAALRTRLRRIYVADWSAKVESLADRRVALAS